MYRSILPLLQKYGLALSIAMLLHALLIYSVYSPTVTPPTPTSLSVSISIQNTPTPTSTAPPTPFQKPQTTTTTSNNPVTHTQSHPRQAVTSERTDTPPSSLPVTEENNKLTTTKVASSTESTHSEPRQAPPQAVASTVANGDAKHLNNPRPPYPPTSRENEEEGVVTLSVYVLANGTVGNISIKKSSGFFRLDNTALKTVQSSWRFIPATQAGTPVASWHTQRIRFELSN